MHREINRSSHIYNIEMLDIIKYELYLDIIFLFPIMPLLVILFLWLLLGTFSSTGFRCVYDYMIWQIW